MKKGCKVTDLSKKSYKMGGKVKKYKSGGKVKKHKAGGKVKKSC